MIDVTCAIIVEGNKILVTQRSETMSLPLKWEFPGGKLEEGELPEACLLREIKEELDIEIILLERLDTIIHDYEAFTIRLLPFIARLSTFKILLNEHKEFKWLDRTELLGLDWASADEPVLKEFLKLDYDTRGSL